MEEPVKILGLVVYPAAPPASLTTKILRYLFPGHEPLYTLFPEIIADTCVIPLLPSFVKGLCVLVIPLKHCPFGALIANWNSTSISEGIP